MADSVGEFDLKFLSFSAPKKKPETSLVVLQHSSTTISNPKAPKGYLVLYRFLWLLKLPKIRTTKMGPIHSAQKEIDTWGSLWEELLFKLDIFKKNRSSQ